MSRLSNPRRGRGGILLSAAFLFAAILGIFHYLYVNRVPADLAEYIENYGDQPIIFSEESGFYENEVVLTLETPGKLPKGAAVYYTMDGTDPTRESTRYEEPIHLTSESIRVTDPAQIPVVDPTIENVEGADYDPQSIVYSRGACTVRARICMEEDADDAGKADNSDADAGKAEKSGDDAGKAEKSDNDAGRADNSDDDAGKAEKSGDGSGPSDHAADDDAGKIDSSDDDAGKAEKSGDDADPSDHAADDDAGKDAENTDKEAESEPVTSTRTQYAVYMIGDGDLSDVGTYLVCLDTDFDSLYDYETGILIGGKELAEKGSKYNGNYMKKGDDWVRPCHLCIFDTSGNTVLEQNIGLAVSGGMSRLHRQKSLNLSAGLPYGEENEHFALDIFPDMDASDCAHVGEYTHLRLRSRSQVPRTFREMLVGQLAQESGYRSEVRAVPCAVYLNGTFYSLSEIEPTFSSSWLTHRFDLPDTDHIEKKKGKESSVFRKMKVSDLFAADLTVEENREALEAAVDMDDYLLYYAFNILDNNLDWPRNNVEAWRWTGDYDPSRPYTDGRLRFMIYDSDKALNPDPSLSETFGTDSFVSMMENIYRGYESRFRDVMQADVYRERFLTILCDLMNTSFETEHVLELLQQYYAEVEPAFRACFTDSYMEQVEQDVEMAMESAAGSNDRVREDIREYFGLEEEYRMELSAGSGVSVTWIDRTLAPEDSYSCSYYQGVSLCLRAETLPGWQFDHWEVNGVPADASEATVEADQGIEDADRESVDADRTTEDADRTAEGSEWPAADNAGLTEDASGSGVQAVTLTIDGSDLQNGVCSVRAVAVRETGERLLISEISAAGNDDWIRLYNAGTTRVDLGKYCLSDDPEQPDKFRLPTYTLEPGESCIIAGSKTTISGALCTCNFMLSRDEILTLTPDQETGFTGDSVRVPRMSAGSSYGRLYEGNRYYWFDKRNETSAETSSEP